MYVCTNVVVTATVNASQTSDSGSNMNQEKSDDETGDSILCINCVCMLEHEIIEVLRHLSDQRANCTSQHQKRL